ncbi:MAG: hypothetical protein [Bacteriophage sp.]|nr:MAG: hypothetical protein [Bacteriophage sp.]
MSKYTTEVRFICETAAGYTESVGYDLVEQTIQKAIPKVFNFEFPMFDESYRNVLCTKILKHYYTREICEETVGLWKLRLNTRLNEIMPYFNQLYKSELLEFNPFYDVDITTKNDGNKTENTRVTESDTEDRTGDGTSNRDVSDSSTTKNSASNAFTNNSNKTNKDTQKDLYSDTPQGSLTNVDKEAYLTNARKITNDKSETDTNTGSENSTDNTEYTDAFTENNTNSYSENTSRSKNGNTNLTSTDAYIQTVKGKNGGASYSKLLDEFRKTFINIDMQIIDNLNDLFFGLW